MKGAAPAPEFLPVSVDIHILDKDIKLRSVLIKPTDTLKEIKEVGSSFTLLIYLDRQSQIRKHGRSSDELV